MSEQGRTTVVALEPTPETLALRHPILLAIDRQHSEIDRVRSARLAGYVRRRLVSSG